MADFLVALADFDRRRLWADLGHASLFYFLHRELGLSACAAQYRKVAADLIQRFPEVVDPLRDGRLCITTVFEVAKVLTPENRDEVLPRFFHLSKREAAAVAAAVKPDEAPPRRAVVTAVRPAAATVEPRATPPAPAMPDANQDPFLPVEVGPVGQRREPALAPLTRDGADPLTADLRRLHVTISARFLEKVDAARAALSHSHPGATLEEILEAGLDLVLERHARRNGLVKKPREESRPSKPDRIPARVKREVWTRAKGCCESAFPSGGTCGSKHRLEYHHVVPRAQGGPSTVDNVRLLCDVHHAVESRAFFGDAWMDQFTRRRREPTASRAAPP